MAAVSAPQAPSALTPPSSSHGGQNSWNYSVPAQTENTSQKANDFNKPPVSQMNGNSLIQSNSRANLSQLRNLANTPAQSTDIGHLAPARIDALTRKHSSISETGSAPDSLLDLYETNRSGLNSVDYGDRKIVNGSGYEDEEDPEHSRWIHRDKLARIESQELQAAGIILPRARAPSKSSRRDQSRDRQGNGVRSEQAQKRQRVGSIPTEEEEAPENNAWDLRTPEEAAEDQGEFRDVGGGVKGVSRIPVFKTSPLPIPLEQLERDTPMKRKLTSGHMGEDESISYPKSRGRSQSIKLLEDSNATPSLAKRLATESSPTKKGAPLKSSTPGNRGPSSQRPKTRAGQSRDASGNQRPPTRSGELGKSNSISKYPEGDPPWLASMYKPDPRLPPDQQLLPTVAKRLQQEQWEKEGKFGNVYDTSFRPLNEDEFPRSPEPPLSTEAQEKHPEEDHGAEWPLRGPKSPALSAGRPGTAGGQGSYSTMPKITGTPQGVGPLPSPKPSVAVHEGSGEPGQRGGCGCCVIM